jgi:hypothetical protein
MANKRKATGPRSEIGKKRSSRNATKFGIFSRATLLESESRAEYEALRAGLWKSKQPRNEFEEILLDKMVSNLWRQRRVLIAEAAEIRSNSEFLEFDCQQREGAEAEEICQKWPAAAVPYFVSLPDGLLRSFKNPDLLERCIGTLAELRHQIEDNGFNDEQDSWLLKTIYGDPGKTHLCRTLQDEYSDWLFTARMTDEARALEGTGTLEQCKDGILQDIDAEIARLKQCQEERESVESKRTEIEVLRQRVPDSPGLDRLLRYMNSLERAFDRILTQYDRAQLIHKG